jgi:CheY-like chemotaxis protein
MALERLLTRRHFSVATAGTVAGARALVDATKFDLLISDVGLPDGNGYDLMHEIGARFGLKGIALTGYGMEGDLARSQRAGFSAHLTKPVRVQALDAALAGVLGP